VRIRCAFLGLIAAATIAAGSNGRPMLYLVKKTRVNSNANPTVRRAPSWAPGKALRARTRSRQAVGSTMTVGASPPSRGEAT